MMAQQIPLVDYLVLGDDPHLVANECTSCGARFFDRRNACADCEAHRVQEGRRPDHRRGADLHHRDVRRTGDPGALRGGGRRLRGHQRAGQPDQRDPRPRARDHGHEGAPGHRGDRHGRRTAPKRSASASNPWEVEHDGIGIGGAVGPRDPHDQVRQAPRQGPRRPGVRGGAGRAGRRRRDHEGHRRHRRRQPHDGAWRPSGSCSRSSWARPASPSTTCPTPAPPAPPRCGWPAWRSRRARPTWAWPSASRSWPAPGLLAGGSRKSDSNTWTPLGPLRRGGRRRRPHRHRDHAGRLRPDRHGVRPPLRRHQLRALRQDQREEPRPLDAEPAGGLHQEDVARRDHERRHDRLPQHPAHVLGQLRRRGGGRGGVGVQAQDAVARAAEAGGEDLGLHPDHRPLGGGVPDPAQRQRR